MDLNELLAIFLFENFSAFHREYDEPWSEMPEDYKANFRRTALKIIQMVKTAPVD